MTSHSPSTGSIQKIREKIEKNFQFEASALKWQPLFSPDTFFTQFPVYKPQEALPAFWVRIYGAKNSSKSANEVKLVAEQLWLLGRDIAQENLMGVADMQNIFDKSNTFYCLFFPYWSFSLPQIKFTRFRTDHICCLTFQFLLCLFVLEKEKIVHYDIKPKNVFINSEACCCIGTLKWPTKILSRILQDTLADNKESIGKFSHEFILGLAPEVLFLGRGETSASNLYQVGLSLLYCLKRSVQKEQASSGEHWLAYLLLENDGGTETKNFQNEKFDIFWKIEKLLKFLGGFSKEAQDYYRKLLSLSCYPAAVRERLSKIIDKNGCSEEKKKEFKKPFLASLEKDKKLNRLFHLIERMVGLVPESRPGISDLIKDSSFEQVDDSIDERFVCTEYYRSESLGKRPLGNILEELAQRFLGSTFNKEENSEKAKSEESSVDNRENLLKKRTSKSEKNKA